MSDHRKVAIIGSGLIGRAWAAIFTAGGYQAQLYDVNPDCLAAAKGALAAELAELERLGARRCPQLSPEQQLELVSTARSLEECLRGAHHVQECVFEDPQLKEELFGLIDAALEPQNSQAAICSSTSVHLPSRLFKRVVRHRTQCLVAHPINPPAHVRLVELVPLAETSEELLLATRALMSQLGQSPVVLRKEVLGFALNRLQFAVFQEAFRLVHDGVMSADDVDTVVSDGLGPRYAFMGPWMTAHLNAAGLGDYVRRFGPGVNQVIEDCQPLLRLQGEAVQQVVDAMLHQVPLEQLAAKRAWRDRCLGELATIKDRLGSGL